MKLMRTVDSDQRPAIPAMASPELADVLMACWDRDPAKRMTTAQIITRLSALGWVVVKGADRRAVKALLARFPLDEPASPSELVAALAGRDRKIAALEYENSALSAQVAGSRRWSRRTRG
jgi:hypothetical protein